MTLREGGGLRGRRVLLVNPWIHDFAAYDLWAHPYGLLSIGAVLRRNGCRVDLVDCLDSGGVERRYTPYGSGKFHRQPIDKPPQLAWVPRTYARYGVTPEKFLRRLDALPRPDAVLVTSMMTYWYPGVFEAIRLIRQRLEGVPVILGGVYATLCHGHARLFSGADMVVAGESEVRVLGIMQSLWGGMPDFIPDDRNLDSFPYPSYDLMENLPSVCIQTSRGCPYRCTYCASSYLSPARRLREPARVVDEVVHWHSRYNVHDFAFIDDALLVGRTRALEMLGALARRSLDVRFHCPNAVHAREIDEEVACLMRQAGVVTIRLGLETAKPAAQIETGGKVTNDEFLRAVDSLHRAGYTSDEIGVYVLCGLPGQDLEEVMRTVEFVQGSGARPYLAEYSPVPQTALWESAVRESPFPLDEEPLFHNNTLFPCANEWFTTGVFEKIRRTARSSVGPGVSGTWSRWP